MSRTTVSLPIVAFSFVISLLGVVPVGAQVIYEGRGQASPWRTTAAQMIDQNRKANLDISVRSLGGAPIRDAEVSVKMKKHTFNFGTAVDPRIFMFSHDDYNSEYAAKIPQWFNTATMENHMKWRFWDRESSNDFGRTITQNGLDWLQDQNVDVRGHAMMWPREQSVPDSIVSLLTKVNPTQQDLQDLYDATFSHINDIGASTSNKVDNWDMLNEPRTSFDIEDKLIGFTPAGQTTIASRTDLRKRWFEAGRAAAPNAKLIVNDFGILVGEDGRASTRRRGDLKVIIDSLNTAGTQLDGIGFQSHFGYYTDAEGNIDPSVAAKVPTSPTKVWELLDEFSDEYNLPIHITEFDFDTDKKVLQAHYTRDFLTAVFAHASVESFSLWGFWEGSINKPEAALFDMDFEPNLNGEEYLDLVFNQWWTDENGLSDTDGQFATRGFLGDYEITIESNGQTFVFETSLEESGLTFLAELTIPEPGDFDLDGDVDLDDLNQYNGNIGATPTGALELLDLDDDGDIDADDIFWHYTKLVETSNGDKGTVAGDTDLDGDVDIISASGGDGFTFVQNIGASSGMNWADGDFDGDGDVDILDVAPFIGDGFLFVSNLGNRNPGPEAVVSSSAVPEPSSIALIWLNALLLALRRRRILPREI